MKKMRLHILLIVMFTLTTELVFLILGRTDYMDNPYITLFICVVYAIILNPVTDYIYYGNNK